MDLMPLDKARQTVRDCLCSDCYGQLTALYQKDEKAFKVACNTEGCLCHGFVSRKFVERQEAESRADLADAKYALRAAAPWVRPQKSSDQLLKELGF